MRKGKNMKKKHIAVILAIIGSSIALLTAKPATSVPSDSDQILYDKSGNPITFVTPHGPAPYAYIVPNSIVGYYEAYIPLGFTYSYGSHAIEGSSDDAFTTMGVNFDCYIYDYGEPLGLGMKAACTFGDNLVSVSFLLEPAYRFTITSELEGYMGIGFAMNAIGSNDDDTDSTLSNKVNLLFLGPGMEIGFNFSPIPDNHSFFINAGVDGEALWLVLDESTEATGKDFRYRIAPHIGFNFRSVSPRWLFN
jgi:hypothetical protein